MASQSKLLLSHVSTPGQRERTIRSIISHLTELYLSNRTRISRAVYLTLFVALINRVRNAIAEQKAASARDAAKRAERSGTTGRVDSSNTSSTEEDDGTGKNKKRRKVELDREFFRSLLRLMRIVVPGWRSKETRLLISHSFFLVVRTLISLKVAAMDGAIVKALVKGNGKEFLMRIVWWMLIAVPATFTNSMVGLIWRVESGEYVWLTMVLKHSCRGTRPSCRSSTGRGSPSTSTTSTCRNSPSMVYRRWTIG